MNEPEGHFLQLTRARTHEFERATDRLDTIAHFLFQDAFDIRIRRTQVFVVLLAKVNEKEILRTSESTLRGIGYGSVRVKEGHLLSIS